MDQNIIDFGAKWLEKAEPREVSRHLMVLPARERMNLLLGRKDGEAVAAALPEQDFYLTVKEIGPDDALPLLAMARVEQLDHIFDLEWWRKDRIQPTRAIEWMDRLFRASGRKVLAWLYHADFELLVTLFKKWIRVVLKPEDLDPVEAKDLLPPFTLDDQFFWEVRYPQYEDLIRNVLNFLFEAHYGFYKELMHHVIWQLEAEVEEEAYRFHRSRLEDRAIPDFYDALEIYRPIRPDEISGDKVMALDRLQDAPPPSFALMQVPAGTLLNRALRNLSDAREIDSLQLELASLANKVVVADELAPDEPEHLLAATGKVAATVNLALDLLTGGDETAAQLYLRNAFLEELFRYGQYRLRQLQRKIRQVVEGGWIRRWPAGIDCLDADWLKAVEIVLERTPRLLRPSSDPRRPPQEDFFRDRADLKRGKQLLHTLMALGPLFDALPVSPQDLEKRLWPEGQVRQLRDVTLGTLLFTASVRFLREGGWRVEPIPVGDWPDVFRSAAPENIRSAIRSLEESVLPETRWRRAADRYLDALHDAYESEISPFNPENPPDPRLVSWFVFEG